MTEPQFREAMAKLETEYPVDRLDPYDNNAGWVENHVVLLMNRTGGIWDPQAARREYEAIKSLLEGTRQ